ncbi:MAG: 2Fe-2S iron-sulfur cluster binding domain-containing protein [Rhizobiaceae bacterium]|nr:2Fe-2S iron-sulfur cluster binding domain-containing protein [Rhizobiaceae bacterium]
MAQMRVASGIILMVYLTLHLGSHALGLISDEVMHSAGGLMKGLFRNWPATIILYSALAIHTLLSFWRVYRRRTLKLKFKEWLQLVTALAIPYFLISHVIGTRYASFAYDLNDTYDYVLLSVFVFSPNYAYYNALGLIFAWLHGCLGMHMWLRSKSWYAPPIRTYSLFIATLLPTLALTGYLAAGQRVAPKATDGEFMGEYYAKLNLVDDAVFSWLAIDIDRTELFFLVLIGAVVLARFGRSVLQFRTKTVTIDYVDGPSVKLPIGASLLEMSKISGVPHANVCGGKGRCSTCRVRLINPATDITPPDDAEKKVLQRVNATEDVRLACQFHPQNNLNVLRLLPSEIDRASRSDFEPWSSGREKEITVMFADLRDFTRTSESRLPFDVVYLINQFSKAMGEAVEQHEGRIDKFLGDGFMALFGVDSSSGNGAANALQAAGDMIEALDKLNEKLMGDLDEPLRMGVGIHTGSVILGNMGYGDARGLTALGDTVNTASRLEASTKEQKCVLCVSSATITKAQMTAPDDSKRRIAVRGKKEKLDIHALMNIDHVEPIKERATA